MSEQQQPSQAGPFTQEQTVLLEQPLDPKRVGHRSGGGGKQLSYIKGFDAIATANKIFGFGKWGYDLLQNELVVVANKSGEVIGQYYAARVRLTVRGCDPITEEGVGEVTSDRLSEHDKARKTAITDAMKRALRCYGEQFGNSLYDTDLIDGQPKTENRTSGNQGNTRPAASQPPTPINSRNENRTNVPTANQTAHAGAGPAKPAPTSTGASQALEGVVNGFVVELEKVQDPRELIRIGQRIAALKLAKGEPYHTKLSGLYAQAERDLTLVKELTN